MKLNDFITWNEEKETYILSPRKKKGFSRSISQFIIDEINDGLFDSIAEKDVVFNWLDLCNDNCDIDMIRSASFLLKVKISQRLEELNDDPNKLYELCLDVVEKEGLKIAAKVLNNRLQKYLN